MLVYLCNGIGQPRMKIAGYVFLFVAVIAAPIAFRHYVFFPAVDDLAEHGMTATNGWAVFLMLFGIGLIPWRVVRYIQRANDHRIPENPPKSKLTERDESDGFW